MSTHTRFIKAFCTCPRDSVLSNLMLRIDRKKETPITREILELNGFERKESMVNQAIEYYSFDGIAILEHDTTTDDWCLYGHYIKLKNLIDVENILDFVGCDVELKLK